MAEMIDEVAAIESTTVGVYRTAATVKGGRRFSFSSLVVVGDRNGRVGVGYGKANQVPPAIEKAQKVAKRRMQTYPLQGRTIPHTVLGRYGACSVRLVPASPGTGVIAGAAVRAPLEMLGIQDCLTKSFGSNNPKNLVKAVIDGLSKLQSKQRVQNLRGVELEATEVEDAILRGRAFAPTGTQTSGDARDAGEKPASNGKPAGKVDSKPRSDVASKAPAAKPETKVEAPAAEPAPAAKTEAPPAEAPAAEAPASDSSDA